jgi:hypothetical protein
MLRYLLIPILVLFTTSLNANQNNSFELHEEFDISIVPEDVISEEEFNPFLPFLRGFEAIFYAFEGPNCTGASWLVESLDEAAQSYAGSVLFIFNNATGNLCIGHLNVI